jgi:hypothetical protein
MEMSQLALSTERMASPKFLAALVTTRDLEMRSSWRNRWVKRVVHDEF